jgi:hypothetical protein
VAAFFVVLLHRQTAMKNLENPLENYKDYKFLNNDYIVRLLA